MNKENIIKMLLGLYKKELRDRRIGYLGGLTDIETFIEIRQEDNSANPIKQLTIKDIRKEIKRLKDIMLVNLFKEEK